MASRAQCDAAVAQVATLLDSADHTIRQHADDRTVSLFVPDLDLTYSARLHDGSLVDVTTDEPTRAQIRLTIHSDDLVDLVEGRQSFPQAFGHGRVHIDAGLRDLFRLRSLL
jgi:hypothetical protein